MQILMTGASGLLGSHLRRALVARGTQVVAISRRPQPPEVGVQWHATHAIDAAFVRRLVPGCAAIINLAGAPVAQRWTSGAKQAIQESRVGVTQSLCEVLASLHREGSAHPTAMVSASAVGFYGNGGGNAGQAVPLCHEGSAPGQGFLAEVCIAWEGAARQVVPLGVRLVCPRFGIVFAREGGALPQLARPIRMGLGAPLGSGTQWMSWVHIDDAVGIVLHALDHPDATGPINVVAPQAARHHDVIRAAATVLRRPLWAPRVPAWALRLALGAMADEMLLNGQHAVPRRALELGYTFVHPTLEAALEAAL